MPVVRPSSPLFGAAALLLAIVASSTLDTNWGSSFRVLSKPISSRQGLECGARRLPLSFGLRGGCLGLRGGGRLNGASSHHPPLREKTGDGGWEGGKGESMEEGGHVIPDDSYVESWGSGESSEVSDEGVVNMDDDWIGPAPSPEMEDEAYSKDDREEREEREDGEEAAEVEPVSEQGDDIGAEELLPSERSVDSAEEDSDEKGVEDGSVSAQEEDEAGDELQGGEQERKSEESLGEHEDEAESGGVGAGKKHWSPVMGTYFKKNYMQDLQKDWQLKRRTGRRAVMHFRHEKSDLGDENKKIDLPLYPVYDPSLIYNHSVGLTRDGVEPMLQQVFEDAQGNQYVGKRVVGKDGYVFKRMAGKKKKPLDAGARDAMEQSRQLREMDLGEGLQDLSQADLRGRIRESAVKYLASGGGCKNNSMLTGGINEGVRLLRAAMMGNVTEVIRLRSLVGFRDHRGWTALHYAVLFGRPKTAKALLLSGASPAPLSKQGIDPLTLCELFCEETSEQDAALGERLRDILRFTVPRAPFDPRYHGLDEPTQMKGHSNVNGTVVSRPPSLLTSGRPRLANSHWSVMPRSGIQFMGRNALRTSVFQWQAEVPQGEYVRVAQKSEGTK